MRAGSQGDLRLRAAGDDVEAGGAARPPPKPRAPAGRAPLAALATAVAAADPKALAGAGAVAALTLLWVGSRAGAPVVFVLLACAAALGYAAHLAAWVLARDEGTPGMQAVSDAIREGAEGYFSTQYGTIARLALAAAASIFVVYLFRAETKEQAAVGLSRWGTRTGGGCGRSVSRPRPDPPPPPPQLHPRLPHRHLLPAGRRLLLRRGLRRHVGLGARERARRGRRAPLLARSPGGRPARGRRVVHAGGGDDGGRGDVPLRHHDRPLRRRPRARRVGPRRHPPPPRRLRLWRLLCRPVCPAGGRDLHQGGGRARGAGGAGEGGQRARPRARAAHPPPPPVARSAPTSWARWSTASPRTTRATRP